MATRPVNEKGVVSYKDIFDQVPAEFVLVIESNPMQTLLFYIDRIEILKDLNMVTAYRYVGTSLEEQKLYPPKPDAWEVAAQFSASYPWYVVNSNLVEVLTYENVAERRATDSKALEELHKKFHPDEDSSAILQSPGGQYI